MPKDQVVVVTRMDDPHTDDLIATMHELGHEPVRLNTDDIPSEVLFSAGFHKDSGGWSGSLEVLTNGRTIRFEAIRSVWWRRPGEFDIPREYTPQERLFAREEIQHAFSGLWASLDCYWVSHPEKIRQAGWKGEQLKRAVRHGFDVPRTLVTINPVAARRFFEACSQRVVYKVLSDPYLGATKFAEEYPDLQPEEVVTHTTLVTPPNADLLDAVHLVPCMFQEYVPKTAEYRVTVIGDELFIAEIRSQEQPETVVDWRSFQDAPSITRGVLPEEVAQRCLAFVKSYGLNYSAIDLILTPDRRYVFLENNPNGQFTFVEALVPELEMSRALAERLISGANRRS